jgi:hypothetical protein
MPATRTLVPTFRSSGIPAPPRVRPASTYVPVSLAELGEPAIEIRWDARTFESPGVYVWYGADGVPRYVGMTPGRGISRPTDARHEGPTRGREAGEDLTGWYVRFWPTPDAATAAAVEAALIRELAPLYNGQRGRVAAVEARRRRDEAERIRGVRRAIAQELAADAAQWAQIVLTGVCPAGLRLDRAVDVYTMLPRGSVWTYYPRGYHYRPHTWNYAITVGEVTHVGYGFTWQADAERVLDRVRAHLTNAFVREPAAEQREMRP